MGNPQRTTGSRPLGKTGVWLPPIGQGMTQTGGGRGVLQTRDRERIRVLRAGVDLGLTLIDTAEMYGGGRGEEIAGHALKGIRDDVFLTSKFNPANSSREGVKRAVEGTLARLQTDYLDLYQIHWPDPSTPLEETLGAMQDLVYQGKVRFIGVSNFTLAELEHAQSPNLAPEIVSNQMEYNLFQRDIEREMLPYCEATDMILLAYSPFEGNSLLQGGSHLIALQELATKHDKSVAEIALRWLLSRPFVVALVKSATESHTVSNARIMDFDLTGDDVKLIDQIFEQRVDHIPPEEIRVAWDGHTGIFDSLEAASRNERDVIPAPESVAVNIQKGNFLKPLPVIRSSDNSGAYKYDLAGGAGDEIYYWAWLIANGPAAPLPVYEKTAGEAWAK